MRETGKKQIYAKEKTFNVQDEHFLCNELLNTNNMKKNNYRFCFNIIYSCKLIVKLDQNYIKDSNILGNTAKEHCRDGRTGNITFKVSSYFGIIMEKELTSAQTHSSSALISIGIS